VSPQGLFPRATCLWLAVACAPAEPAVIGVAFQGLGVDAVAVARDELAEWTSPVHLTFDTTLMGDPADIEVARATHIAKTPGLAAVVGHGSSRGSLAAAPVYHDARIPQIVPTGTSRLLEQAGPWTFALAPNDSVEGAFIAEYVAGALAARTVTIFFVNDEYGVGLRDGVLAGLHARGVVVIDEVSVDPRSDFSVVVEASIRRGVPDVVVSAARWVETGAIARLFHARMPGTPVVAGDGALLMPDLAREVGDAASSLVVVSFWLPDAPDSLGHAFAERFRRVIGREPVGTHAMTHDAIMLAATAIREVGSNPDAVRQYLASLGIARSPYRGVTGPIAFTPGRRTNFVMTRLAGDGLVRVSDP
jgi:branched-chain amino acid transport system substrate-binding protein